MISRNARVRLYSGAMIGVVGRLFAVSGIDSHGHSELRASVTWTDGTTSIERVRALQLVA